MDGFVERVSEALKEMKPLILWVNNMTHREAMPARDFVQHCQESRRTLLASPDM